MLAARSFRLSVEETLRIWSKAVANEGEESLRGIVVEDPGFAVQLSEVLRQMDSSSHVPSAVYSPIAAFRSVPDLGAYPITGCPFLFSNYLFICSSAAEPSHSPIVETPSAEPILVV